CSSSLLGFVGERRTTAVSLERPATPVYALGVQASTRRRGLAWDSTKCPLDMGGRRAPPSHDGHRSLTPPLENVSVSRAIGSGARSSTVSWNCCVATSTQTLTLMLARWPPSMITNPGPEKVATDAETAPAVGVACTFMMCARPKPPRTSFDRPAIRQLKLPDG